MGGSLGVVEALSLSMIIGIASDGVLHLAHAYNAGTAAQHRFTKTWLTLSERGHSTLSGCLTNCLSTSVLMLCQMRVFAQFGFIFALVGIFSMLWSLVGFIVALMLFGPVPGSGAYNANYADDVDLYNSPSKTPKKG